MRPPPLPRLNLSAGTGLFSGARQLSSPHQDARPPGVEPELIIIHGISLPPGSFGGPAIDELFTGRLDHAAHPYFLQIAGLKVSSHLLIRRNGEIVQYVPLHQRAWHAGQSIWRGRKQCNDFSVGIELEGVDDLPYTPEQYRRLATVIRLMRLRLPSLSTADIVGHSDVAPGRKTDPGPAFDWARLRRLLATRGPASARGRKIQTRKSRAGKPR
ncbi:MAG: 1,6-anhydro-N-acetylmuramyl-L-alanine amidase AmpD [Gammaproteobacteria bacterium]